MALGADAYMALGADDVVDDITREAQAGLQRPRDNNVFPLQAKTT